MANAALTIGIKTNDHSGSLSPFSTVRTEPDDL